MLYVKKVIPGHNLLPVTVYEPIEDEDRWIALINLCKENFKTQNGGKINAEKIKEIYQSNYFPKIQTSENP